MAHSSTPLPHISSQRLWESLESYARIGGTPEGGVSRSIFSEAEALARAELISDCQAIGLAVRTDAACNVFALRDGDDPTLPHLLIGSHLDSVPEGGKFDGALGTICALEVLRSLHEAKISTRHAVQLVCFNGEEATAFGTSTFGSRALARRLPDVAANMLPDGRTVRQALADSGGDWAGLSRVADDLGTPACFLEVHLEQGRRLETAGIPLACVSGVTGIYRQRISFRGSAGHAGTTAMRDRQDALRAAAAVVLQLSSLPELVAAGDPVATATVGYLTVRPNSPNVIPGAVDLVTDLRSVKSELMAALADGAAALARAAAEQENVGSTVEILLDQAPVSFDPGIRRVVQEAIASLNSAGEELASQAGHDAVHLGTIAPAGMIFVRCRDGISHHADEAVTAEDAALAAEALLLSVLALDRAASPM